MCNIPNEIQPPIQAGGLFGPDSQIPWGEMPGYRPPDDWTSPEPPIWEGVGPKPIDPGINLLGMGIGTTPEESGLFRWWGPLPMPDEMLNPSPGPDRIRPNFLPWGSGGSGREAKLTGMALAVYNKLQEEAQALGGYIYTSYRHWGDKNAKPIWEKDEDGQCLESEGQVMCVGTEDGSVVSPVQDEGFAVEVVHERTGLTTHREKTQNVPVYHRRRGPSITGDSKTKPIWRQQAGSLSLW